MFSHFFAETDRSGFRNRMSIQRFPLTRENFIVILTIFLFFSFIFPALAL